MTGSAALDVRAILERARGRRIVVMGDVMLDRFVWGNVSRISPEAPVPVVEIEREDYHLGGAANVARNLASLGARPLLLGVVGDDEAAGPFREVLRSRGLSDETIVTDSTRRTTVKTRIIASSQQVVRADWETVDDVTGSVEDRLLDALSTITREAVAIVLSDYSKGALTPRLIGRAIELAHGAEVPVLVDPKLRHYRLYKGVELVTPNLGEAERFTGIAIRGEPDVESAARAILEEIEATAVLVTRGEHGMSLFEVNRPPLHIPTFAREVFDVSGAGDTVIATAAVALGTGASLAHAAELANRAAGIVVGKLGTATVEPDELVSAGSGAAR